MQHSPFYILFFFNDTATTEIYTLSLHDALPISSAGVQPREGGRFTLAASRRVTSSARPSAARARICVVRTCGLSGNRRARSEEHTSELQSRLHLVCRLLLEKKNNIHKYDCL